MSELNINIFNIVIISGVLHGIIFSLIVFTNKKYITNNTHFLALVVLFLSLSNFQYWLIDTNIINRYLILKFIYIPWQWLVLPMFYLYVNEFIGQKKIVLKRKLLLFGPFVIVCTIHIFLIIYSLIINSNYTLPSHFERGIYAYSEFLSIIFNVLVMYFTFKIIDKHEKNTTYNIKWVKSESDWLKRLIYIGIAICICWVLALAFLTVFDLNASNLFYPMWILISILVYWIGYVGITKSKQLKNRIELRNKLIFDIINNPKVIDQKGSTFDKIQNQIIRNKLYLNAHLSLEILSKEFDLSESYISQLFAKNSNKNFNDYINNLRVNEAKIMLTNIQYSNYTIVSIGLEAGFNSKSSFYAAFKKFTKKTPVEFIKSVRNI